MLAVCGVVAGMALVTGILVAAWGPIRAKLDYRAHLLRERELEELFAGQAIEQIYQTLSRDMDARDYPKFQEVWEVYGSYDAYRRSLESLSSTGRNSAERHMMNRQCGRKRNNGPVCSSGMRVTRPGSAACMAVTG